MTDPDRKTPATQAHPLAERALEQLIFASRWLMAPFYLGLVVALGVLMVKFVLELIELVPEVIHLKDTEIILGILTLIDLSLAGNLLLIVIFAGYENFVSKLDVARHKDRPEWMGTVDFSGLKLRLVASIVAISAIHLLKSFMNVSQMDKNDLMWLVIVHGTFVLSGVLLAFMDRIAGHSGPSKRHKPAAEPEHD
ncbi:MAG: TIGR00645 family protein [Alphaproteobacteria bacterium]